MFDTIAAPITGYPAPVALIRLSGPESWRIARLAAPFLPNDPEARRAYYGSFDHGDDGLALLFESGASYTGEESAELSVHGSVASVEALLERCYQFGARPARPGEFTERAFLNGRIDLTQAEGVRDAVDASTELQLRQATLRREGALRRTVEEARDRILKLLGAVEASVDFSEEIGDVDPISAIAEVEDLEARLRRWSGLAETSELVRRGIRIAIVGPPNAGKSSLLNALLGRDRAIVAASAGTTRDTLEENVVLGNVLLVLTDTAGLREAHEEVESEGIRRARAAIEAADAAWYVFDRSVGLSPAQVREFQSLPGRRLLLANKSDLPPATMPDVGEAISISALQRSGFDSLARWAQLQVGYELATREPMPLPRHALHFSQAADHLRVVRDVFQHDQPHDLASTALRAAAHELGSVTGASATEDMVERIFRDFCIGK